MSIHTVFEGSRLLTETVELLAKRQLYISVGDDFNEYKALISQCRPHQPVSLPFDTARSDMTAEKGAKRRERKRRRRTRRQAKAKVNTSQPMRLPHLVNSSHVV